METQILKDYFRNAADIFIDFVYQYNLLTPAALYELEDIQKQKFKSNQPYPYKRYEDYRNLLGILHSLANRNPITIYKDRVDEIPFTSSQILRPDLKIKTYLRENWNCIHNLADYGHEDAHHLSIQEHDERQIVKNFILSLKDFIKGFPIIVDDDTTCINNTTQRLNKLYTEVCIATDNGE